MTGLKRVVLVFLGDLGRGALSPYHDGSEENETPKQHRVPLSRDNPKAAWLENGWNKLAFRRPVFYRAAATVPS
jgi:hypothetical protein